MAHDQIKITMEPNSDLDTEIFYEKEEEVLDNLVEKINSIFEVKIKERYIEWAKPYGHDPYIIVEYKSNEFIGKEQGDEMINECEKVANSIYDKFEVKNVQVSGIV